MPDAGYLVTDAAVSWRRILIVAVLGIALAWLSLGITANFIEAQPDLILRAWPWSARAKAALANEIVVDPSVPPRAIRRARDMALSALRREPVNVAAARALGLAAARENRTSEASRWFAYSERLSRRDLVTQSWLIEQAVGQGDIAGALRHYDRALRTSVSAEPLLLPVLKASADDPAIAAPLGEILARRPNWRIPFLVDVVQSMRDAGAITALVTGARLDPRDQQDKEIVEHALRRLLDVGHVSAARRLQGYYDRDARRDGLVRDPRFGDPSGLSPFVWALGGEDTLRAERDIDDGGRTFLAVTSSSGRGGVVASQLLLLDPGRYAVSGSVALTGPDASATPTIRLTCLGSGVVWSGPLPVAADAPVRFGFDVAVPGGCAQQRVDILASAARDTAARLFELRISRR